MKTGEEIKVELDAEKIKKVIKDRLKIQKIQQKRLQLCSKICYTMGTQKELNT